MLRPSSPPVCVPRVSEWPFVPTMRSFLEGGLQTYRKEKGLALVKMNNHYRQLTPLDRYCNMDYILLSALAPLLVASVFVSYDIACQFKLKFDERVDKLPPEIQLPPNVEFEWGIPKCHCPMHKVSCQAPHSLNFKNGVGRTDGEGIERSWSELNRVANSTKEMGPGSRHDTLDDHIGHHNFRKYVGLGTFTVFSSQLRLMSILFKADLYIHVWSLPQLRKNGNKKYLKNFRLPSRLRLRSDGPTSFSGGRMIRHSRIRMYPSLPVHTHSFFLSPHLQTFFLDASQDEVKRQLLKEEAIALKAGVPQLHDTSRTGFITLGLLVEENQ